jgi:hypothetical protein
VAQRNTQKQQYWDEQFSVEQGDLDHLYSTLLDQESPLSVEEMALILVRYRVQQEEQSTKPAAKRVKSASQYHPTQRYKVGDKASFPSMNNVVGRVVAIRPGTNAEYGSYSVLDVEFEDGATAEFASDLSPDHLHAVAETTEDEPETTEIKSPEEIFIDWGGLVIESLEQRLAENADLVRLAGRWFPKSLLANVNSGHLNLAEAVLDMNEGGPMATTEIIEQAGMMQNVGDRLAEFSLNYGLQQDPRFDEVGPSGHVLWYLTRLEPEQVQTLPERLEYATLSSDDTLLSGELKDLERQIGDEHSTIVVPRSAQVPQSVTVTLIYPHRRVGTLPLSPSLRQMFPTAQRSPRIRFTLIDADTGTEYPAWVVREGGYVFGLAGYFEEHEVLPGSILTIERTKDASRVKISAGVHKPRKEWVRTAAVQNNRLRFESAQRPVSTSFDELMIVDVTDPDAVDELSRRVRDRKTALEDLMGDVMRDLAALNPQGHVHAKSLYSALNLVRRTPPGPVFARLVALPEFEQAGGPYWRLRERVGQE